LRVLDSIFFLTSIKGDLAVQIGERTLWPYAQTSGQHVPVGYYFHISSRLAGDEVARKGRLVQAHASFSFILFGEPGILFLRAFLDRSGRIHQIKEVFLIRK
jgi:hypothetical protein